MVMKDYLSHIIMMSGWSRPQRRAALDSPAYKAFSPYSPEDEETRRDMVLLGPFDHLGHPTSHMLANIGTADAVRQGLIRVIERVAPLDDGTTVATNGTFTSTATGLRYDTYRDPWLIFVNASALRILSLAAPALTPQRLWAMQMESYSVRGVPGVNYGPIYQGGSFLQLHRIEDDCRFDQWVADFLLSSAEPTEHDRRVLMMGPGNMWVFVRPDRFPVTEAFALLCASPLPLLARARPPFFADGRDTPASQHPTLETLPVDVLLLTCSHLSLSSMTKLCSASHTLLAALSPFLDSIARRHMAQREPWYLPPPDGQERAWFHEQCKIARSSDVRVVDNSISEFPWFWYARACRESPSMRNRKRIWGIARQLLDVARDLGVLEI